MQSLTLGDITFVADAAGLGVELPQGAPRRLSFSPDEAGLLEEFLRRNLPRERRVGFRVRIAPLADRMRDAFKVRVEAGDAMVPARPVDLSLTGALLHVDGLTVQRGATLAVELTLEDLACVVSASVVRREGRLVALHFVDSLRNGELAPPESLLGIYRRLETAWLRTRIA